MGFLGGTSGKEPTYQCRRWKRCGFDPWAGTIPWKRAWQPTPVFLPGEFHGENSLAGYNPWGQKELDKTGQLSFYLSGGASGKESSCQWRRHKRREFDPWVGKILWRRNWQPTPKFLPGESHGQRNLAGYSPWCCKELDTTEQLNTLTRFFDISVQFSCSVLSDSL